MKKKFTLEIINPCSENFDEMIPSSGGSFCNSCAKNVIDLSRKTNSEIVKFVLENKDKNICARLKTTQLKEEFHYNETSKISNLKYAAVAASVLLVSNVSGQEKESVKTEINAESSGHLVGKVTANQNNFEDVSIVIKGKLLEAKTNQPFDKKKYPNLKISINGSQTSVKVNSKTGDFSIPILLLDHTKTLQIAITGNNFYFSKEIPFELNNVKESILIQNVIINEEELSKAEVLILGGFGINYR